MTLTVPRYDVAVEHAPKAFTLTVRIAKTDGYSLLVREAVSMFARQHAGRITGESGSATLSAYTIVFADVVPAAEAQLELARLLNEHSLADIYRLRGANPQDRGFQRFTAETDSETLRKWVIRHFQGDGIDERESYAIVQRARRLRYVPEMPLAQMKPKAGIAAHSSQEKIDAYTALRQEGVVFPPIVLRHNRSVLEGFHRHASATQAGLATHAAIRLEH